MSSGPARNDRERLLAAGSGASFSLGDCFGGGNKNKLPSALPKHWPNPLPEDLDELPQRRVQVGRAQAYDFHSNFVKTSKYEMYNFVPKFLMEEFNPRTKIANCYFGVIGGLQCIPQISNTLGLPTTYLPLSIVLAVNAVLQAFEDLSRHRADAAANASITLRWNAQENKFKEVQWKDLVVGDFVKLESREVVPADVVVLSVAEKDPNQPAQGICYVETKSLDGETNLKVRNAMPNTIGKIGAVGKELSQMRGNVEMEHPNKLTDSFQGVLALEGLGTEMIQLTNVLLRGCVLRNTDWIIGLVVNTGHDTKIMMSSRETRSKTSNLESLASQQIGRIIIFLLVVCFTGTTGQAIWNSANHASNMWYLGTLTSPGTAWIAGFFYFFLLHATFIPVSLYVSMSLSRSVQSYFMNNDKEMFYEETQTAAMVRTMTLNEELGQISHVFSDKTGTLTCNIMDFRKASINGVTYGQGITEIGKASWKLQGKEVPADMLEGERRAKENSVPHVTFWCPNYEELMRGDFENPQRKKVEQFFRCLSICHDTIPERINGEIKLSASNPDDDALVCAATHFGFQFCDRREKFIVLRVGGGGANKFQGTPSKPIREEEIELLETIEFTSKRKRMSVLVRDGDGKVVLYCKGADTVMLARFTGGQDEIMRRTDAHSRQFADEGLRCLLLGTAIVPEAAFTSWHDRYRLAKGSMKELDKRKKGEANLIDDLEDEIERGLTLLGATAIEDRLQDGVPECIAQLGEAGINFWVLTGDKEETAINIAVACNLVLPKPYMRQIIVNAGTAPTREAMLKTFTDESTELDREKHSNPLNFVPRALIIDGPSLITAMADDAVKDKLLELSKKCKAVVGCRVSPDQKRLMVDLIKRGVPEARTLAIGDGANDVAMIQEAHIGVGIKGEEGVQAVNSADYAIAQFKYLRLLVLQHGRYNYIRMSHVICYMFYKNILMSSAQFWFNFSCAFSGQKIYVEWAIQFFNLFYTSIPIILLGAYDMDIGKLSCSVFPKDYMACIRGDYFNGTIFWSWIGVAVLESIICSVLPYYTLSNSEPVLGNLGSFWEAGATCMTVVVIVCNLKILFIQSRIYWFTLAAIAASIAMWFITMFIVDSSISFSFFDFYGVFRQVTANGSFWLTTFLLCTLITGKDAYLCALERRFNAKNYQLIQELEVFKKHEIEDRASAARGGGGSGSGSGNGKKSLNIGRVAGAGYGDADVAAARV